MAGIIKTSKQNCTENSGSSFSLAGVPLSTATVFTKTFTVVSGHVFNTAPSIILNSVTDKNSYTITVSDTGSIAGGNLTARSFVVKYKYPLKQVSSDTITFIARAKLDIVNSVGKIYDFDFNNTWVRASGETRTLSIYGDKGDVNNAAAALTVDFKRFSTSVRSGGAGTVSMPDTGIYQEDIVFPSVTGNKVYSIILTQIASNSFLTLSTPKTITINQYINPTLTVQMVESGSDFLVSMTPITLLGEPFSTPDKEARIEWYVTSQSSIVPMRYIGSFDNKDFSGLVKLNDGTVKLAGGSRLDYNNLVLEIYPTQTGVTTGSTATTTITLNATNVSVVKGMRVSGNGISKTGAISPIVTNVVGPVVTLGVTPGSTIPSGTTLTFHSAAHITGDVVFNEIGTSNQTSELDVANILGFNRAPVPSFTGVVAISAEQAGGFTTRTLAASDADGDVITFAVTVMPQHGTFKYTDVQNNIITVTCSGQTLSSNNTINASTKTVHYKPADGNSQNTSFKYVTSDSYHTAANSLAVTTTITLQISA